MQLSIKNMVCDRCIAAVDRLLKEEGLHPVEVRLGEAKITEDVIDKDRLQRTLKAAGFALLDDRKSRLVERIKNTIVRLVHHTGEPPREKYSQLIAEDAGHEYPYLSKLFSESEGTTIEQFLLRQKIEKVKEYLNYDELTLSEIAEKMGYSSVAHLSAQFRKVTGQTPTEYKTQKGRTPLDQVG
ncbi:MAG TPA: helix-turn-helix domain-containing protein [Dinghuibacter sp.]|uniref:AraC family transcriptional regulator n=1 Tax=Dinghuibacter sp. TaxID=2024697 RepID=UPI002CF94894|nr:helix-turn-helix domain-containing protein [Dinghuibacter sp.]HTJ14619.1 helix-turn-helix domain-containing protein [Dinghuibacter sp.]